MYHKKKKLRSRHTSVLSVFRALPVVQQVQFTHEFIQKGENLGDLVRSIRTYAKRPFWKQMGALSNQESIKLLPFYLNDESSYFPIYKFLIRHSTWTTSWEFLDELDFSNEGAMKRAATFLCLLNKSDEKKHFARYILHTQHLVGKTSTMICNDLALNYPFTRNSSIVKKNRFRRVQLKETLHLQTATILRAGVSNIFMPFMTEEEKTDIWIVNHAKLNSYHLRLEYCASCTRFYICDYHRKDLKLIALPADMWDTMRALVQDAVHVIVFDGMTRVQSMLFLLSVFGQGFLPTQISQNMLPHNPKNLHRSLCGLIVDQQTILHDSLAAIDHSSEFGAAKLLENAHSTMRTFPTMRALRKTVIENLEFCRAHLPNSVACRIQEVLGLEDLKTVVHTPEFLEYMTVFCLRRPGIMARIGDTTYVFGWNNQFMECHGKIKH